MSMADGDAFILHAETLWNEPSAAAQIHCGTGSLLWVGQVDFHPSVAESHALLSRFSRSLPDSPSTVDFDDLLCHFPSSVLDGRLKPWRQPELSVNIENLKQLSTALTSSVETNCVVEDHIQWRVEYALSRNTQTDIEIDVDCEPLVRILLGRLIGSESCRLKFFDKENWVYPVERWLQNSEVAHATLRGILEDAQLSCTCRSGGKHVSAQSLAALVSHDPWHTSTYGELRARLLEAFLASEHNDSSAESTIRAIAEAHSLFLKLDGHLKHLEDLLRPNSDRDETDLVDLRIALVLADFMQDDSAPMTCPTLDHAGSEDLHQAITTPLSDIGLIAAQLSKADRLPGWIQPASSVFPGSKGTLQFIDDIGHWTSKPCHAKQEVHFCWVPCGSFGLVVGVQRFLKRLRTSRVLELRVEPPNGVAVAHIPVHQRVIVNRFCILQKYVSLCSKVELSKSLQKFQPDARKRVDIGIPPTFSIFSQTDCEDFVKAFSNPEWDLLIGLGGGESKNLWIAKPAEECGGRGIQIFSEKQDMVAILQNQDAYCQGMVFQKYIERPHLIHAPIGDSWHNVKYSLRVHVLVTAFQPQLRAWFYQEAALLRLASSEYDTDPNPNGVFDARTHITNTVQHVHEGGPSVKEVVLHSDTTLCTTWTPEQKAQMQKLVVMSLLAARSDFPCSANSTVEELNRYQLLGYDFMVDTVSKVWLLEVNSAPCFGSMESTAEKKLVTPLLRDLVHVVLDVENLGTSNALPQDIQALTTVGGFVLLDEKMPLFGDQA